MRCRGLLGHRLPSVAVFALTYCTSITDTWRGKEVSAVVDLCLVPWVWFPSGQRQHGEVENFRFLGAGEMAQGVKALTVKFHAPSSIPSEPTR